MGDETVTQKLLSALRFLPFAAIENHMVTGNPIGNDKIKYIESKALYTHNNNITLYISAVEPPVIQSDTFYGFNAIHVPSGSLDLYKSANNWSAYGDYMIGDL